MSSTSTTPSTRFTTYLKRVAGQYSHLARLVEIGKSRGGLPILAVEICNPGTRSRVRIQATVANVGWMPTATAYAAEMTETAKPVKVELSLENADFVEGLSEHDLGVPPGARDDGPERKHVEWQVRIVDPSQPARAKVTVIKEKAGTFSEYVDLIR